MHRRAEPRGDAGECARQDDRGRGDREPAAQQRHAADRLHEHLQQTSRRLVLGGRPDLARGEQRHDGRDEEKRDAEVLPEKRALHTELVERVADRVGNRTGRHLGDDAERERGGRGTHAPREEDRQLEPNCEPEGRAESERSRRDDVT